MIGFAQLLLLLFIPFDAAPSGPAKWNLGWWLQRRRLEREGVKAATEKRLKFDDEAVVCIGGSELSAIMRHEKAFPDTSSISLSCLSGRGLEILFVGEPSDLQPFYTFVSQIRRHG